MDNLPPAKPAPARADPVRGARLTASLGRLARIGFAVLVVGATLFFLHDRFFTVQAQKALMAGQALTLRAPIEGRLDMHPHLPGAWFGQGDSFASIVNERVDTQRLDELRATLEGMEAEVAALVSRMEATRVLLAAATGTADSFRQTRLDQLRARIAEGEALLGAAQARLREAEAAASRGERLLRQGIISLAAVQGLRRDLAVARDEAAATTERVASLRAEEEGARRGIFAADNASDRSVSQQNMDRLSLALVELETQLAERRARRDATRRQLEAETARVGRLANAPIETPEPALLARLLVQPGETVRPGQELARLISCAAPLITAELDERGFRQTHLGQQAEFRPLGGGPALRAEVIQRVAPSFTPGEARALPQVILRPVTPPEGCETGRLGAVHFH